VWAKEAFGDFHGFVAGWTYWIYRFFTFPVAAGERGHERLRRRVRGAALAQDRTFLLAGFSYCSCGGDAEYHRAQCGKWLQNAGAYHVCSLLMLVGIATVLWFQHGSVTHFTWANMMPHWSWDTVNFWSQIAFAFTDSNSCRQ